MGGRGGWNRGIRSVVDSNYLCSEYDSRVYQSTNETDSWERDHSYNTGDVTVDGKYLGEEDTCGIDGIQGRHIVEYSEKR